MSRVSLLRAIARLALLALLALVATGARAGGTSIAIALDTDNNPATGCTVASPNGPISGVDLVATTIVGTTTTGASVTRLERQTCNGTVLGAPVAYDSGGWNVGLGSGTGGSAAVETSIPLSMLPPGATLRAVVTSNNGSGGQDATLPFTFTLSPAVTATSVVPVPLAPWLLPLLGLVVIASTLWLQRRYPRQTGLLVMLVVLTASGLAWAATVLRDGNVGDWIGIAPAVTDAAGDAPANADLLAVFRQQDGANLYLRVDADIRTDVASNQAPVVNAGPNQAITLPAAAALSGSAVDDGLPNPPGALTYAWIKVSGPGTVTFANAASAATTASFGAAGSYVLRLTASDSLLSAADDITVTVNPIDTLNQPPVVSAGLDQAITLPAAAALAGTATDDGLPNPPGVLVTTWSLVSGPASGVVFGNPNSLATTASFVATGTYVLRLTANDGSASASSTLQVTVNDGAPVFAAIADRTIQLGTRLQVLLQAVEGNASDPLTYSIVSAPAGATLNPSPLLDWTPTASQLGNHLFTVQAADTHGHVATTSFHVTVAFTNSAPVLAPQNSQAVAIGSPFTRTLTAVDPDVGDALTFALVAGPSGMSLSGAALTWSTSARNPGDYAVTVKVTDAAGLTDQKSFTLTLLPAAPGPLAKDDTYSVKVARELAVPAPGVLSNDFYAGIGALTATRVSSPGAGTLSAFNSDGSFTYQAPAAPPGVPLSIAKMWNTGSGGSDRYHELVADLNADGYPDVISFDNNAGIRARSGQDGSQLWSADRTGATDCQLNSGGGSMDHRVLADIDDSGHPSLAQTTYCAREGSNWHDNIIAFDHLGKLKWVSPPLSKPHPDIRHGTDPVPPAGFTPGGLAWQRGLSVARLTAGGPPVLLMRVEIPRDDGYTLYYDAANQFHYAGCRAVTGLVADENVACRATLIISGTDGSVVQMLVVRNPAVVAHFGGPGALSEMPPIAMDIDGDGRVDLVSGTEVWMQNAGGGFDFGWQLNNAVNDTAVADLDGDGKAEIIHLRSSGESNEDNRGIFIYSHDGQFKRRIALQTYWFTPLTIADVDGDGRSDIVLGGDGTVYAFRDDGRPIWAYKVPPDVPSDPILAPFYTQPNPAFAVANAAPQVYDLDGDGVAEVVFSAYSRIIVLDGRTGVRKVDPYWTFNHSYNDVSALILADMNNDGHVDIVQNASFNFNCLNPGVAPACAGLVGPVALSGGGSNNWLPGPKAWPNIQYRSTAIDANARVLHDTTVSRIFRVPVQQGTVRDPRLAQATSFTYTASDGTGPSAPATVYIDIAPDNEPPVFTSTPPKSLWQRFAAPPATGLVTHFYNVSAIDPDPGDTITFSLKSAPSWVTMSGPAQIRFEPTCGSYGYPCPWGQTTVIVTATDSRGASTDQIFIVNLTTASVTVPNVVGMSLQAAEAALIAQDLQGLKWIETFDSHAAGTVLAQDAVAGTVVGRFDDIRLTISKGPQPVLMPFVIGQPISQVQTLLANLGLSFNLTSTFSPTIPAGEITAQTPAAGTLLQPATAGPVALTVSAGGPLAAPIARIDLEPGSVLRLAGDSIPYRAVATLTNGTSADVTFSAAWSSSSPSAATVDTSGVVRAIAAGSTTISASVASSTGSALLTVAARAAGDNVAPTAAITSPSDGAAMTAPTAIVGTAADANFLRYELAIAPAGETTFTLIAQGTTAVTNGTLATLDPATLVNDLYTVRLTVFDRAENESAATTTVQVSGERKVGLFTLTYQDLGIPAAGIPVIVNRTYDSRDKTKGDFGIGWRLGFQTLRLRANRVPGTGWARVVSGPLVTLTALSEHKVSVTLADGKVEEFDMKVSPMSNIGSLDATTVTGYQARPGTLGQLQALANSGVLIVNGGAEDELVDDTTLNTYEPQLYRYTAADGTQFEIGPRDGVKKVSDANGNTVTFGPGGILHSNGQSVTFTRDAQSRIVAIQDPMGNVQSYSYDPNGDLATHANALGGVSRFAYDRSHGLIEVRDAAGVRAVRNEYDASGRLVAVIDASGSRVEVSHDSAAQEDVITDRRGHTTRIRYDAVGNIVATEQPVTVASALVNAVTVVGYDALGNETSRVDPDGRRTAMTYSGTLPVTQVGDPGGLDLTTTLVFNARNDVVAAADAAGRDYAFGYDGNGNVTAITTPQTGTLSVTPGSQGQPMQSRDALGTVTALTRDATGNVTREEVLDASAALLRRTDFTYDANGNKTSETLYRTVANVRVPFTTRYAYDAANRLTHVTDAAGGVSRIEYDAAGRVTARIDALGRRTTLTYDALGRATRTTFPDGTFETTAYDANNNIAAQTDAAGRTTTFAYDELDRQIRATHPDGTSTQTLYSAGGSVTATIDANGNRTDYVYDAAGRLVATTLPAVADGVSGPLVRPRVTRVLNALGAATSTTDPNGRATSYAYDAEGRLVQTTFADGATTRQNFDVLGRRTSEVNEEGQTTHFAYDGLGRLISVTGYAGDATYGYDEAGNLLAHTDALGRLTRYRYDALNRLVEKQYPGGETVNLVYDAVGNVVSTTDPNGRTTTFVHDAMNRVIRKTLPGGTRVDYAYAADGQRATVTDARGVTAYSYDARGRLASVVDPAGATIAYTRDGNGNLLSLASPAAAVHYGYDALNRLVGVTGPQGEDRYFHDLTGNRVRRAAANGIVSDFALDARYRPTQVTHKSAANAVLQAFANVYSPSGRRTQVTEQDGSITAFGYDAKGRLTAENRTGANPYAITHAYDAVGNRTQTTRSGNPTTFIYDADDRLLSDGASAYAYDANGNLVTRTSATAVTTFGYDGEDRLVTVLGGSVANQYGYDPDGNRVIASNASQTTHFLVDSANASGLAQVLEERDGGGNLLAHYVYGNELVAMKRGATTSFPHRDAQGSIRGLTGSSGTLTDSYLYDAYGNSVAATGATVNPYRYGGERLDADTSLYQLRARYYHPSLARFASRDPLAGRLPSASSLHPYVYAGGDPVNNSDPSGQESLVSLSVAQSISNGIEAAEYFGTAVVEGCNLKERLDLIGNLIMWGGLSATALSAVAQTTGFPAKTAFSVFGVNPVAIGANKIKSIELRLEMPFNLKVNISPVRGAATNFAFGLKGFSFGRSLSKTLYPIDKCGIPVGNVNLKGGLKAAVHDLSLGVSISGEIELLKVFRYEYPIFEVSGSDDKGIKDDKVFGINLLPKKK